MRTGLSVPPTLFGDDVEPDFGDTPARVAVTVVDITLASFVRFAENLTGVMLPLAVEPLLLCLTSGWFGVRFIPFPAGLVVIKRGVLLMGDLLLENWDRLIFADVLG